MSSSKLLMSLKVDSLMISRISSSVCSLFVHPRRRVNREPSKTEKGEKERDKIKKDNKKNQNVREMKRKNKTRSLKSKPKKSNKSLDKLRKESRNKHPTEKTERRPTRVINQIKKLIPLQVKLPLPHRVANQSRINHNLNLQKNRMK